MKNLRGKSPAAVHHLVQKPCAGMLCLPGGVGVDVHSRINIRVPLQLLHIFGNRAIGEKTTGEGGGTQRVEMEVLQTWNLFFGSPAYQADIAGGFNGPVRIGTYKNSSPVWPTPWAAYRPHNRCGSFP